MSRVSVRALCASLGLAVAAAAAAQEPRQGPVTPPPKREVKRIPADSTPEPPPVPVEEIIRRFTAREAEQKRIYDAYDHRLTVRVQEFPEEGGAGGEWQVTTDITTRPDGTRVGRVVKQAPSTLKRASFSLEDIQELASEPWFVLTPDQRDRYDITYQGTQPLDELTTYIFRVQPRRLERRVRQFDGLVWVDDRDLAIVKSYGRMVTEVDEGRAAWPFTMYETYREMIAGRWLPTYSRSEDTIRSQRGEARLRLTIRISDYRPPEAAPVKPQ